jgi:hypothetical protein
MIKIYNSESNYIGFYDLLNGCTLSLFSDQGKNKEIIYRSFNLEENNDIVLKSSYTSFRLKRLNLKNPKLPTCSAYRDQKDNLFWLDLHP